MFADQADIGQSETLKRKETLFKTSYMAETVPDPNPKWKCAIYRLKQIGIRYAIQIVLLAI